MEKEPILLLLLFLQLVQEIVLIGLIQRKNSTHSTNTAFFFFLLKAVLVYAKIVTPESRKKHTDVFPASITTPGR